MFYCIECDQKVRNETLEDHILLEHPLTCSICDLTVPRVEDMQSHIESYHPGVHVRW